ncbi:thiopurine S-methyltransferase [Arsukibacterium ikkense]|uniref:Thiopurine S-methyltransferase n=1 Tax=Arsukibacterium ikkense TaxID=336831 RepID=A0A0M2V6T1_9GAMM|nr:thiopurine S-methyltransferase [Arsukibacterium ikkense]KKO45380.1 thiopurine S-methyltransferase [Arsukibacterium ikkense]
MEADFWLQRWQSREIGFHQVAANPLLVSCFKQLALPPDSRVFIPLCGKTLDIGWLLASGYRVVGAELSEIAVKELFAELGITPTIKPVGSLQHYAGPDIEVFVGDIFKLSAANLGPVDAIYDRAALVALPATMRQDYAQHLITLSECAPQLVICFEYDQAMLAGPPFAVDSQQLQQLYGSDYQLYCLQKLEVPGGLKRKCQATELAWLLKPTKLGSDND